LRERKEDVAMLTRHFLQQSAKQLGVESKRISDAALAWVESFAFPGNVRQLENMCHWLTVMAPAQLIEPKDLPPEVGVVSDALPGVVQATSVVVPPVPAAHAAPVVVAPIAVSSAVASAPAVSDSVPPVVHTGWEADLEAEAVGLLGSGRTDVWDVLTRRFESRLILAALAGTRGRRIEAAHKLGIGRNTITRKIQELGLE
jgi:two-component system nitrogen regulation response regulator GlnG